MGTKLWTEKYRPVKTEEIAGQQAAVSQVNDFLRSWRPGTGMILFGAPGTGKTLLVGLIAEERGDFLLQMDASDKRTARDVEGTLSEASRQQTLFHKGKIILMDEVDSMSGRSDRGGAGSIVKIIRESKFPVFICVNDIKKPKLREIKKVCKRVKMDRLSRSDMKDFLRKISDKEGLDVDDEVLNGLARWSDGDVRSVLLDLQMLSLDGKKITEEKLLSLGFRERKKELEDVVVGLMRNKSINANRASVRAADVDPDELFLWLESNIYKTSADKKFIADAYEKLSKADMFRGLVHKQQNWRFKSYMIDVMSGIASLRDSEFIKPEMLRTPDRIVILGRTRFRRMLMEPIVQKIAEKTHSSMRAVNFEYMPYMMFFASKGLISPEEFDFSVEEMDALKKYGNI
ncbi:MAG: replication factor C large subunit [Candidatus Aenigmarchaeota archaeon]|nr:replication factor C large subunit [Candidatus Aenigmarchaeota archaeon]